MDIQTIVTAIAGIVVTGALSNVGEKISDKVVAKANHLLHRLKELCPDIAFAITKSSEQKPDFQQICSRIQMIESEEPEIRLLLQDMVEEVRQDLNLRTQVQEYLDRQNIPYTLIEHWKGINVKGTGHKISKNKITIN